MLADLLLVLAAAAASVPASVAATVWYLRRQGVAVHRRWVYAENFVLTGRAPR